MRCERPGLARYPAATARLIRAVHVMRLIGRQHREIPHAAAGLTVCNDFGNNVPYSDYLAAFSQIRAPVVFPKAAPNLEPRDDIWPTETAPVFRRREEGGEPPQLQWGFPPARPKGAPGIHFRP